MKNLIILFVIAMTFVNCQKETIVEPCEITAFIPGWIDSQGEPLSLIDIYLDDVLLFAGWDSRKPITIELNYLHQSIKFIVPNKKVDRYYYLKLRFKGHLIFDYKIPFKGSGVFDHKVDFDSSNLCE